MKSASKVAATREAAAIGLEARTKQYLAGAASATLDFLLEAQQVWADALRAEYDAIVQYNNALAAFEFNKGTIMRYDNVAISEGQLPKAAQVRAVEHEREISHSLVIRQRASGVQQLPDFEHGQVGIPNLPSNERSRLLSRSSKGSLPYLMIPC